MDQWTEDEKDILFGMRCSRCSWKEIGQALGRSDKACKSYYSRKMTGDQRSPEKEEVAGQILAFMERGYTEREIAHELSISRSSVYNIKKMYGIRLETMDKIKIARRKVEKDDKTKYRVKKTICWTCKNSLVNCKKPVEGFIAEKVPFYSYLGVKDSYIVTKCPNYEEEDWVKRYRGKGRSNEL